MSTPDPFYYLRNFQEALSCVSARNADLLIEPELDFVRQFEALTMPSQALLVRLVMRQGDLFRRSVINYAEIGYLDSAIEPLIALGWIDAAPALTLEEVFRITARAELAETFTQLRTRTLSKVDLYNALSNENPSPATFREWLQRDEPVYRVVIAPLVSCFRWLFFGSDRPWSEFVLVDLGIFEYEQVPFDAESRPFSARSEIEFFFELRRCEDGLHAGLLPAEVLRQLPVERISITWLAARRDRVCAAIGQLAERTEDWETALDAYSQCMTSDGRVRRARLLERLQRFEEAESLVAAMLVHPANEVELQAARRIDTRLRRRRGAMIERAARTKLFPVEWALDFMPETRVEQRLKAHLATEDSPVLYVENSLICSLFGLLCWPAIFAPIRGAFFHRFQAAPVDLWASDFVSRRSGLFDLCLGEIDSGEYQKNILNRYKSRFGVRSPFVHWQAISVELLELALGHIPAQHLRLYFDRLLQNLRDHSTGLPDLVQFNWGGSGYRLIEVKGPGDQLQDNQRRWIAYARQHELPIEVHRVRWTNKCESPVPTLRAN